MVGGLGDRGVSDPSGKEGPRSENGGPDGGGVDCRSPFPTDTRGVDHASVSIRELYNRSRLDLCDPAQTLHPLPWGLSVPYSGSRVRGVFHRDPFRGFP